MQVGSLFAGIGGFDLAARWMGWETIWYSEIDPYASAVMKKNFPNARNLGDITQIDGKQAPPVDILCGGFPCQDISLAGSGAGLDGKRSGLWSHYKRLIEEIRPHYAVIENVSALRSRGLDQVLGEIAAIGYAAEWHCIPAASVGAPHRRDRIWIIAYPECEQLRLKSGGGSWPSWTDSLFASVYGETQPLAAEEPPPASVSDTNNAGLEGRKREVLRERASELASRTLGSYEPPPASLADSQREGELQQGGSVAHERGRTCDCGREGSGQRPSCWCVEPDVGRVAHGVPSRVDRLKCLGNAIVPQVAFEIFKAIEEREHLK